jgi:hypothetical protein
MSRVIVERWPVRRPRRRQRLRSPGLRPGPLADWGSSTGTCRGAQLVGLSVVVLDEKERRRGSVHRLGALPHREGERQSAAAMDLGMHTCFRTALASHHKPAIPAYQGRGVRALLRAACGARKRPEAQTRFREFAWRTRHLRRALLGSRPGSTPPGRQMNANATGWVGREAPRVSSATAPCGRSDARTARRRRRARR